MTANVYFIIRRGVFDALDSVRFYHERGMLMNRYRDEMISSVEDSIELCRKNGYQADDLNRELEKVERLTRGKGAAENPGPSAA